MASNVYNGGTRGNIQVNIPPNKPWINAFVATRCAPLRLPANLHDSPDDYLKHSPRFNGEIEVTSEDHVSIFQNFVDNLNIE